MGMFSGSKLGLHSLPNIDFPSQHVQIFPFDSWGARFRMHFLSGCTYAVWICQAHQKKQRICAWLPKASQIKRRINSMR